MPVVDTVKPKSGKGTRLPENWSPQPATLSKFRSEGYDARSCIEPFRDWWMAAAGVRGVKADWEATFRTWVRKAIEQGNIEIREELLQTDKHVGYDPNEPMVPAPPELRALLDRMQATAAAKSRIDDDEPTVAH